MNVFKHFFAGKRKIPTTNITRRFDLISRVGQGSMSKVWRARDTLTGGIVALKILDRVKTGRLESRFANLNKPTEGEIAVQLRHPHIVRTLEHGLTTDREQFLVMEFIDGLGLSYLVDVQNETMRRNRMRFILQIGSALDYFHKANWIHRDLCPRNVLIDRQQQVKLIDFGLVVPNTPEFQQPGNRTGTAQYMAPELIKRKTTDQRIDIYAFALTCYEMFTRRLPWDDVAQSFDTVMQHINVPPRDIREFAPGIDEQVAETIMRGLHVDPDLRWQSVSEMLAEFQQARARLEPESAIPDEQPSLQTDEGLPQQR